MATAGAADGTVKVWDLRTWRELESFSSFRPATSMDVSQRGLLALGMGPHVHVRRLTSGNADQTAAPYMKHMFGGRSVESVRFCPFEDILGVGHSHGFGSVLIPGAGEPIFDSRIANPFETTRQRRDREIRSLLDKLSPATIALDPSFIGTVDENPEERLKEIRAAARAANEERESKKREKKRARGRNKIAKKLRRKQKNVIDESTLKLREKLAQDKQQKRVTARAGVHSSTQKKIGALQRFYRKKS